MSWSTLQILDIHDVIFYTETRKRDRAFATSFEFQTIKLVANSGLFWGASVCMNINNKKIYAKELPDKKLRWLSLAINPINVSAML